MTDPTDNVIRLASRDPRFADPDAPELVRAQQGRAGVILAIVLLLVVYILGIFTGLAAWFAVYTFGAP